MLLVALAGCRPAEPRASRPVTPTALPARPPAAALWPPDAVSGRDDLACDAPGAVSWRGDAAVPWGGRVVPAEVTRRARVWTCLVDGREAGSLTPRVAGGDLLVIVLDDVGLDRVRSWGGTGAAAITPALDALPARGVWFRRAWAMPVCSSSRAALLTGRRPARTGVGEILVGDDPAGLGPGERLLPEVLAEAGYASAALGKWHVTSRQAGADAPRDGGFDRFRGTFGNLEQSWQVERPDGLGYARWEQNVDGALSWAEGYATAAVVDDALDALGTLPEPWFALVALHAAHGPAHVPPEPWRRSPVPEPLTADGALDLLVESVDVALERLLGAAPPDATVVVLADNGTTYAQIEAPYPPETGKGSVYEGGVRVPFSVSGPLATDPGPTDALVSVADVAETARAIAGLPPDPEGDGVSFLPVLADRGRRPRETVFAHRFSPNGPGPHGLDLAAIRDERFKLVRNTLGGGEVRVELYDLGGASTEGPDLGVEALSAEAQAAYDRLWPALEALRAP